MKSLHVSGRTMCVFDMTHYYTVAIGLHVLYERIALMLSVGLAKGRDLNRFTSVVNSVLWMIDENKGSATQT